MDIHASTPPVLRFALRVLDAANTDELARTCVCELVDGFGAVRASVRDDQGIRETAGSVAANTGEGGSDDTAAAAHPRTTLLSLRLSGPEDPPVRLELEIERGPDLAIVRQQFLDLVGVVRRAWIRLDQLARERTAARRDALTGLDNRRAMTEAIDVAWQDMQRSARPMSVMLVDLDRFKHVNDTCGHEAGDDVLQHAGSCFVAHLRPSDRVCRWGGDEFLIFLSGVSAIAAIPVADRLRSAFASDPRARGTTMTIGIADTSALSPGAWSSRQLVALADESLLLAKREGRDRTRVARAFERTG